MSNIHSFELENIQYCLHFRRKGGAIFQGYTVPFLSVWVAHPHYPSSFECPLFTLLKISEHPKELLLMWVISK